MSTKQTSDRSSEARSTSAEQLSIMSSAATETFERVARQNHAIMGDMIDWTLASMRIPTRESDAKSMLEAQAAEARGFAGKARMRMQEYVDIAGGFGKRIAESPAGSEQARRAVATATEQAHEAIENAGGTPDPMARAADAAATMVSQAAADTAESASAQPSKKKAAAKRKVSGKKSAS